MDDETAKETMQEGFAILCMWARNIAMLPLEEWDRALDHSESVGAILNPTLYREYIYSDKAKVLREILKAAIPLKRAVLKAQPIIREEIEASNVKR